VAGAFLPWEEWLAKLLHPLYVRFRREMFERQREKDLSRSTSWPKVEGVIRQIEWDTSLPREGVRYSYNSDKGYYSGLYWRWLERDKPRNARIDDHILLSYNPDNPEDSVFLDFQEANSPMDSVSSVVKGI
jgi:hypothetical protein